eukprot:360627-Chlamydomonas_euryale.AAC.2
MAFLDAGQRRSLLAALSRSKRLALDCEVMRPAGIIHGLKHQRHRCTTAMDVKNCQNCQLPDPAFVIVVHAAFARAHAKRQMACCARFCLRMRACQHPKWQN